MYQLNPEAPPFEFGCGIKSDVLSVGIAVCSACPIVFCFIIFTKIHIRLIYRSLGNGVGYAVGNAGRYILYCCQSTRGSPYGSIIVR
jgi:hypothetical protein